MFAQAATLVFDASDPASFECVAQWLRANVSVGGPMCCRVSMHVYISASLTQCADMQCFKMLVGTKCDLGARVDPAELCGCELFMTSAKDGANFREVCVRECA